MFWVKDTDGNLVNLAKCESIYVKGSKLKTCRWDGSEIPVEFTLCIGAPEELGRYRDHLFDRLTKHQEHVHIVE